MLSVSLRTNDASRRRGIAVLALVLAGCTSGAHPPIASPTAAPTPIGAPSIARPALQQPPHEAAPAPEAAPTWGQIYERYLAVGSVGSCARSAACHGSQMSDAASAYQWLREHGFIDGAKSALVQSNSCLRWFGGNMPPRGADDRRAVDDLVAWVAAGARQD